MNTGHGPGYRYDRKVGQPGDLRGAMLFFWIVAGICYVLQLIF